MPEQDNSLALPKDLVAASATPLILAILSRGDSYGYAIIQAVRELSGGEMEWADGMLYPILHRLEKKQLIEAYWGRSDAGRKRKYYRIVALGRSQLAELRASWRRIQAMFDAILKEKQHV